MQVTHRLFNFTIAVALQVWSCKKGSKCALLVTLLPKVKITDAKMPKLFSVVTLPHMVQFTSSIDNFPILWAMGIYDLLCFVLQIFLLKLLVIWQLYKLHLN